jgi:hypothetical protein
MSGLEPFSSFGVGEQGYMQIDIDRIRIQAKGLSPEAARRLGDGLPQAIADALIANGAVGSRGIARIDVGTIRIAAGHAESAQREIAASIAKSISPRQERNS